MIYQIKLQYGFMVEAEDKAAAYALAAKSLRENPGMAISSVFPAMNPKNKSSLLMRIIKGY
jgi:hypothetical protein